MSVAGAGVGFGTNGSPSLLATLDAIAREAAVLIREVYATKFSVDFKAPRDSGHGSRPTSQRADL